MSHITMVPIDSGFSFTKDEDGSPHLDAKSTLDGLSIYVNSIYMRGIWFNSTTKQWDIVNDIPPVGVSLEEYDGDVETIGSYDRLEDAILSIYDMYGIK